MNVHVNIFFYICFYFVVHFFLLKFKNHNNSYGTPVSVSISAIISSQPEKKSQPKRRPLADSNTINFTFTPKNTFFLLCLNKLVSRVHHECRYLAILQNDNQHVRNVDMVDCCCSH